MARSQTVPEPIVTVDDTNSSGDPIHLADGRSADSGEVLPSGTGGVAQRPHDNGVKQVATRKLTTVQALRNITK